MKKKPFIAIVLVTLFMLLVLITILTFKSDSAPDFLRPVVQYHLEFMVVIALSGMLVGAAAYYLMSEQVERTQVASRKNVEILLKFLSQDESKVVKKLLNKQGNAMQYELSRLEGLTRLKVHRILSKLERQGIVHIEKIGKVNSVTLAKEILDALE